MLLLNGEQMLQSPSGGMKERANLSRDSVRHVMLTDSSEEIRATTYHTVLGANRKETYTSAARTYGLENCVPSHAGGGDCRTKTCSQSS